MLRTLTCVALAGSMLVGATPITVTVPGGAPYPAPIPCTREKRLQIATNIIEAFNDPDPARSFATIQNAPFKPNGFIDFCINGAPCLRLGPGAQGAKNIANAARQAVANVVTEYTAFDNGTTIMDAVVTFGVGALGVPVPVKTDIYVDGLIDTQDCQIIGLPAYLTVPTEVLGMPVRPPILPDLGIGTIPPITLPF
ncbi:uncharacterized protein RHO25_011204 [Cercospora beticola]|uniref:Ecp2 effector protein domain-containing protein n=1 Tax=Cercospora beticola TaxID=122368 RepID=A0ABZ0P3W1_CERBT|nr:hypothetical protein RHO25_011204 [Cercospora beticola]CAK1366458.1 unnamed protein product [Cercospora beticola]